MHKYKHETWAANQNEIETYRNDLAGLFVQSVGYCTQAEYCI